MSAYVSPYLNLPSRSSSNELSSNNRNTDWLDGLNKPTSRQTYSRQYSENRRTQKQDEYPEDNRNVRYKDAGMVSDATKWRNAGMSNDDLRHVSQYDKSSRDRDRLGSRFSQSTENVSSQYGPTIHSGASYSRSLLSNDRSSSPDRARTDTSTLNRYQSTSPFRGDTRYDSNFDENLVKSSERTAGRSYPDTHSSVRDFSRKSDSSSSSSRRHKENIEPEASSYSTQYTKSPAYDASDKYSDAGSRRSKSNYQYVNGRYEASESSKSGRGDQLKYEADMLSGTDNRYSGFRQSSSARNLHDDLLYDSDERIKYSKTDPFRTSSKGNYSRDTNDKEGSISRKYRSSSGRSEYLDDHDEAREKTLMERLRRLESKHAELEDDGSGIGRLSTSVPDNLDRKSSQHRAPRSTAGNHLSDDLYDRELSMLRSYESGGSIGQQYHTGYSGSNPELSPRHRRGESVLRENQRNASDRRPSDRESKTSSTLGIRRDARSLEESLEKKSVTWGENSFHELLGDYMSDNRVKQSNGKRDLRRMDAVDAGRKILDVDELKEERRKRLETLKSRNAESSKYVKVDLTGTDCETVYDTVQLLGLIVARPKEAGCSLIWNDSFVSMERISLLEPHQRINHFAGMDEIGKVGNLVKNINRMFTLHPNEYNFLPKSWVLPEDMEKFQAGLNQAKTKNKKQYFIVKPSPGSSGRITLCSSTDDISKFTQEGDKAVVQKYIENPLLINKRKSHIRLYAVVTSCCPLRVLLYSDGLVHLAVEKYKDLNKDNMNDFDAHLTSETDGSKLTLRKLFQYLEDREAGGRSGRSKIDKLWARLDDLVVLTLLAAHPSIYRSYNLCRIVDSEILHRAESVCFELLAFDVLLDAELKPWLLQVTRSPDFSLNDGAEAEIKPGVIEDALLLLNLKSAKKSPEENTEAALKALNKLEENYGKPASADDIKSVVKTIKSACSADFNSRKFSEGCGRFRLVFPPRDKATLETYCEILESAHTHLLHDSESDDSTNQSQEIHRFIVQKNREHVNNLIKNRASVRRTDVKSFEKIDINEELTLKTLKALTDARITLPGRNEKATESLLDKTMEKWSEHKPKIAEYWFIYLGASKQGKVIDIVKEKVRDIALRTWGIVDVERVRLYRIFLRVFTRLLVNHGQAFWDCFDPNRKTSSWEMIFSKSTEVISATELECCRRVVQLCCDCLLVMYHCAVDVRASLSLAS